MSGLKKEGRTSVLNCNFHQIGFFHSKFAMFSELTKDITIFHIPNIPQTQRAYDNCINVAVFLKIQMYKPIKHGILFYFFKTNYKQLLY